MKRLIPALLFLTIGIMAHGQNSEMQSKNSLGVLFSPGYKSVNESIYAFGLRGTHAFNKIFSAGAEVNYQTFIGTYGNSDAVGGIAFGRITPFGKGLFAELGVQTHRVISSSRYGYTSMHAPFVSLGYQQKICDRMNLEFQFRPITLRGNSVESEFIKTSNISSKCYIALGYSF